MISMTALQIKKIDSLLKELPEEKFQWKRANPIGSLLFLRKTPSISGLALCYFLIYLAAQAVQGNWSFYTTYRFKWTEGIVGASLAVVGLLVGAVQGGLTRVLNPKLGNEKSIYLGLTLYTVGLVLFGLSCQLPKENCWIRRCCMIIYLNGARKGISAVWHSGMFRFIIMPMKATVNMKLILILGK